MSTLRACTMGLVVALVASACSKPAPPPPPPPRALTVGAHRVTVVVPVGWSGSLVDGTVTLKAPPPTDEEQRKLDYQGTLSWTSFAEVIMRDLGPVSSAPLGKHVDDALPGLTGDNRREVASRTSITIEGVEAEEVKVWDRLSHNQVEYLLFIANGGSLFLMTHAMAGREHSIAAYEVARASLRFVQEPGVPQIAR